MNTILLIEDNIQLRENTAEILELDGYKVLTAGNGKEGVELALREVPNIIVCDIMMPELDGYGVLHLLSKNPKTENIPFIFLSAKAERSDLRKGMEMGADDYLTKPFDDIELLNAIESRLKKKEVLEKKYSKDLAGLNGLIKDIGGDEELEKLKNNRRLKLVKKKVEVYREGEHPSFLFFIQKGNVKTFKTNESGKELIINIYQEGDFLGYQNLMTDSVYSESASAIEDTELLLIPKSEFNDLLFRNKQVAQKFIGLLAKEIKENEEQLIQLAYNSVRKRIAEALLLFYEKKTLVNGLLRLSREDLSNLAGTSLETAIRTLSDFKEEGLVDIISGKIKFVNIPGLEDMRN